jgi:hypothetical protein
MLPYIAFTLAVIFVILKISGAWDEFTSAMRNIQRFEGHRELSKHETVDESDTNRLEVFREFLEGPLDEGQDDSEDI